MTRQEYIRKFTPAVLLVTAGTGLFPSVMMAQAILESSDSNGIPGNSILASNYHNHFGIKADKSWKGASIVLKTREVIDGKSKNIKDAFRVYGDPLRSFSDRIQFLKQNKRYTDAGVFRAATPADQADALQAAGYATDPAYANLLKQLITKYHLTELDAMDDSST
jgi:flagellum-specific peptidoglycan hydrolase FlgJ